MLNYPDNTVGFILDYLEYLMVRDTLTKDSMLMEYANYIHDKVDKLYHTNGEDYTAPEDIVRMSTLFFNVVILTEVLKK